MDSVHNNNNSNSKKRSAAELVGCNLHDDGKARSNYYRVDSFRLLSEEHHVNDTSRFKMTFVEPATLLPHPDIFDQSSEEQLLKEIMKFLNVQSEFNLYDIKDTHKMEMLRMAEVRLGRRLGYGVLQALIEGCIKESAWSVVACLITLSGGVSSMLMPDLIDTILANKQTSLVPVCIRYMCDISAEDLVKLIKYCLAQEEAGGSNLDFVLSSSQSQTLMVNALRSLTMEQVKLLWRQIFERLRFYLNMQEVTSKDWHAGAPVLTLQQLATWITMLLESHSQEWARSYDRYFKSHYNWILRLQSHFSLSGETKAFLEFTHDAKFYDQAKDTNYSIHVYHF